jgi:putative ABC transport system ATP-binding protein
VRGRHRANGQEPQLVEVDIGLAPAHPAEPPSRPPEHQPIQSDALHVSADRVTFARAGRSILDGVSLVVGGGESLAVVGPSGSGKSTLLALLAGLDRPDSGTVDRSPGRLGLVLQGYGLASVLTAAENVEAPLQAGELGTLSRVQIRERAATALDLVGLTAVADHLVEELSGGQQQRVAVARALAVDPAVLLADELTAELDHDWKERVVTLVLDVATRGGLVVLATHDLEVAARCHRRLFLANGQVSAP